MKKKSLYRLFLCILTAMFLLPCSVLGDGSELEVTEVELNPDAKHWSVEDYVLPLDLDFKKLPAPIKGGFSDSKDENGKPVYVYEDSTIRVVVSQMRYYIPDIKDKKGTDVWMADITITDPSQLRTASAAGRFSLKDKKTAKQGITIAKNVNAVAALSGDSWGASEKDGYGVVIRQGELIDWKLDGSGTRKMDLLLIDVNGDFHVIRGAQAGDLENPLEYEGKQIIQGFAFGPVLVEDGEAVTEYYGVDRNYTLKEGTWIKMNTDEPAQRMAFCQVGPLHYLAVACATAYGGNRGLTLPQLAKLLESRGVQTAYNLDGGFTTMLYFHDHGAGGKINQKSTDERKLWDIIYFVSAEGAGKR